MGIEPDSYPLRVAGGIPLVRLDGQWHALDTGSPLSFARPSAPHAVNVELLDELIGEPIAGIIGTDQLDRRRLVVRWRDGTCVVSADGGTVTDGAVTFDLRLGVPAATARINGEPTRVLIDTCASHTCCQESVVTSTDYNPVIGHFRVMRFPTIEFAGHDVTPSARVQVPLEHVFELVARVAGRDVRAIIGADVLQHADLTLDFITSRAWFEPAS